MTVVLKRRPFEPFTETDAPHLPLHDPVAARWYVAAVHSGRERFAKDQVADKGFATFLPMYLRRRSHAGRYDNIPKPLFPGYLFVRFSLAVDGWQRVNYAPGVLRLLCLTGDRPVHAPMGLIDDMRAKIQDDGYLHIHPKTGAEPVYREGQRLRLKAGAFVGFSGLYLGPKKDRIRLLIDFLGRKVHSEVNPADVEPVS